MTELDDESVVWRRCELAWSRWLQSERYAVVHLNEATGNMSGTRAPLIAVGGKRLRAPDLQTTRGGTTEYWEIKFRSRPDIDPLTGARAHWIAYRAFRDYVAVAEGTRCKVWVILYEGPTSTSQGRWLRADIHDIHGRGRQGTRFGQSGSQVDAWIWPTAAMEVVSGPEMDLHATPLGLLPSEDEHQPLEPTGLIPLERKLRRRPSPRDDLPMSGEPSASTGPAELVLQHDPSVGLDVLRRSLGIATMPRYSVLRVGLGNLSLGDVLGLLHYGIRVFLITGPVMNSAIDLREYQAFKDSRLLEWAVVNERLADESPTWIVDGIFPKQVPPALSRALLAADEEGGINLGQYNIIHAPADSDVLVTAGAGTGKTETMSERLVYLLATDRGTEITGDAGVHVPYDLRADDIVLMTFTREAAQQMRERISGSLMLRQRLCRRSVLPALAWMLQLSSARIVTIHAYAKHIVQSAGGALGLSPDLTVRRQTMAFQAIVHDALSPHLSRLIADYGEDVPASHLWQRHIRTLWDTLENNGVEMMPIGGVSGKVPNVEWGSTESVGLQAAVEETTKFAMQEVATRFRDVCFQNQSIPTSELVPFALAALTCQDEPRVKKPRYLFVDEFQDTDALQMDLILEIKARLGSRLFVVGDAKQGIYRFRGAEGNAFHELHTRVAKRKLENFNEFRLSRNFRSGARLLGSLHSHFARWGSAGLLIYAESDKLRPQVRDIDTSMNIRFTRVPRNEFAETAAVDLARWRREAPKASIAVLCRRNWQAVKIRAAAEAVGMPCELLVGGSFYSSPAVRELNVLLQVVTEPQNDAALLQLCETRWAAGILTGEPPLGISGPLWGAHIPPLKGWHDRFGSLARTGSYDRSDLQRLRLRIQSLAALLNKMPVIAWITECARAFVPEASRLTSVNDESERKRYTRCFDHLVMLLDANFEEGPVSIQRLHSWLQLQIATNNSEDEPVEWDELEGKTTALTVHKAKGLEFDRVLVPNSWTSFEPPQSIETRVAILRGDSDLPELAWQWKGGSDQLTSFSNVSSLNNNLWARDDTETAREEARLLYVALTRARDQLQVYLPSRGSRTNSRPESWAHLLTLGD